MERYSLVAARILISIIFLLNGLNIIGQTLAEHEMAAPVFQLALFLY
jgi:putative oxidoreductase